MNNVFVVPQGVTVSDVRREPMFCEETKIPILGVVENMSEFVCPHCKCKASYTERNIAWQVHAK